VDGKRSVVSSWKLDVSATTQAVAAELERVLGQGRPDIAAHQHADLVRKQLRRVRAVVVVLRWCR